MINRNFIILCISACMVAIGVGIIAPILPIYARDLGASGFLLGVIFSSFYASMALCNPFVGKLSDRFGKKKIVSIGFGFGSIIAISYVWVINPTELIIVRLAHGVIGSMVIPIIMAMIGDLSKEGKEGTYMGVYSMMAFLGMAAGPSIGGKIADYGGTDLAFYVFGALTGIVFILTFFLKPSYDVSNNFRPKLCQSFQHLFTINPIKGLVVFNFIISIAQGGLMVFLPILAKEQNLTTTQIGILASVFVFLAGVLQVPFGWIANRYDRVNQVMIGTLIVSVCLAFFPFMVGFFPLLIISSAIGISSAVASPAANALLVEHSRVIGLGFIMGAMNTIISLGMITGPIIAGIIMDKLDIRFSFYLISFIFIIGAVLFYCLNKKL